MCALFRDLSWTSDGPLLLPKRDATHDVIAVKDPTIVRHNDLWHVYASTVTTAGAYNMAYTSFPDWSDAPAAVWYHMDGTPGFDRYVAAPQLFYFTPQKKWYLIFQGGAPTYSTSDDPGDPTKWTTPEPFYDSEPEIVASNGGWLDFWIICDEEFAHLFFSNDHGRLYKAKTTIGRFPHGFTTPVVAMEEREAGRLYEACCVYRVKGTQTRTYLALIEAFDRSSEGRRYYRSFTASDLEGPWTVLHDDARAPFAGRRNVTFEGEAWTHDVSHGELVRGGNDETMTVDVAEKMQFLVQGFEPGAETGAYNRIPWAIGLLRGI